MYLSFLCFIVFHSKIKISKYKKVFIFFLIYQIVDKKNMMNSEFFFYPILKIILLVSYIKIHFFFLLRKIDCPHIFFQINEMLSILKMFKILPSC